MVCVGRHATPSSAASFVKRSRSAWGEVEKDCQQMSSSGRIVGATSANVGGDALRCKVSRYDDAWADVLPTVEYAHATAIHSSTKLSPFELDTGGQPATAIRVTRSVVGPHGQFVQHREELLRNTKKHLEQAQARQTKYYNKTRKEVTYEVGDLVYTDAKVFNLNEVGQPAYGPTKDPTVNKLLPRWIGPYPVSARTGTNAYRLKLPHAMSRRHPSFNVDQLKRSIKNPPLFEHRVIAKAAPANYDAAGERIYVAERLEKRRIRSGKTQYLVKWLVYPPRRAPGSRSPNYESSRIGTYSSRHSPIRSKPRRGDCDICLHKPLATARGSTTIGPRRACAP
ncbi:putative reverse transcriptase-RNase H-integrase [Phytophthora infestans]|uniref:Putative reverse transcriptase-RNase H-integrase n=1 Tax=Phytophthora infestans TaxID=4787 RepID=A0A833T8E8_PHYIN|nr:putative reverse transcriptase-RNase H-integrase [Phytophthora infestans]